MTNIEHFHGSDLEKIEKIYGIKREDIISFSANVNPLGISDHLKRTLSDKIDCIASYPDREYTSLRTSIGKYLQTDYKHIIVGNGSTELISLIIQIKQPKKAMIIGPTYSEYEREITLGGGTCLYHSLQEELDFTLNLDTFKKQLNESIDMLVLCNPNNPTSTAISKDVLRMILDVCKQFGIFVVVDETYVEFVDKVEDITGVSLTEYYNNLFIIRGVSKFFAAPGLRLGYGVCGNADLLNDMNTIKKPWTINALACIAGEIMFSDTEYIEKTRTLIKNERERVLDMLKNYTSIRVYEPSANFILFKILKSSLTSKELFEHAIAQKLMIRDCSSFPFLNNKFVRFCFMHPEQNDLLLAVLKNKLEY